MRYTLIFFLLLFSPLIALVDQDGDTQLWLTINTQQKINDKLKTGLVSEVRIGDDISKPFFVFTQPQLFIRAHKWVEIAPGYRQVFSRFRRGKSSWHPTYSPLFDLSFLFPVKSGELSQRNRVQYLITPLNSNKLLYRNRVRFIFPIEITLLQIKPYIDDELFYLEGLGISQNRFTAGILPRFTKNLSARLYYMLRLLRINREWRSQNILGIEYYIIF